jgi:hypothetical protein
MLGKAAIVMWWDVSADARAEWEEWHTYEHMPERLGIPGFLRGTRWVALGDEGSFFVLYEAAELATITSGPYLERLNNPTPWSRRMMPHHRNMVRSLCVARCGYGAGVPAVMATVRFSGEAPELPRRRGVTGAHFLESQPVPGAPTAEQKIRGGDATADKVLLIGGYDAQAVRSAAEELAISGGTLGVYRVSYSLSRS